MSFINYVICGWSDLFYIVSGKSELQDKNTDNIKNSQHDHLPQTKRILKQLIEMNGKKNYRKIFKTMKDD